jgi:hypothetical protein
MTDRELIERMRDALHHADTALRWWETEHECCHGSMASEAAAVRAALTEATSRLAAESTPPAEAAQVGELPALPKSRYVFADIEDERTDIPAFSADQMHAYARAAIAALRQPSARDEHVRWLGLNMLVCAARQRGGEDEQACAELDALWKTGEVHDETDWVDAARWLSECVKLWPKDDKATPPPPAPSADVGKLDGEWVADAVATASQHSALNADLPTYCPVLREAIVSNANKAIESALNQAAQPDETLADTQRAIIEAAERRGYERGLKEAQQQPVAQGAVSVWMLRDKDTGEIFSDPEECVWWDASSASEAADMYNDGHGHEPWEPTRLYLAPPALTVSDEAVERKLRYLHEDVLARALRNRLLGPGDIEEAQELVAECLESFARKAVRP